MQVFYALFAIADVSIIATFYTFNVFISYIPAFHAYSLSVVVWLFDVTAPAAVKEQRYLCAPENSSTLLLFAVLLSLRVASAGRVGRWLESN